MKRVRPDRPILGGHKAAEIVDHVRLLVQDRRSLSVSVGAPCLFACAETYGRGLQKIRFNVGETTPMNCRTLAHRVLYFALSAAFRRDHDDQSGASRRAEAAARFSVRGPESRTTAQVRGMGAPAFDGLS